MAAESRYAEVPRPDVTSGCLLCKVTLDDVAANAVIVSPVGKAHFGSKFGLTDCGKDATGDAWWWPL